MKSFKKYYLPDSIEYAGKTLTMNAEASAKINLGRSANLEANFQKEVNEKTVCIVEVMSKNLRGKNDLYGQPYKPTKFIFSN